MWWLFVKVIKSVISSILFFVKVSENVTGINHIYSKFVRRYAETPQQGMHISLKNVFKKCSVQKAFTQCVSQPKLLFFIQLQFWQQHEVKRNHSAVVQSQFHKRHERSNYTVRTWCRMPSFLFSKSSCFLFFLFLRIPTQSLIMNYEIMSQPIWPKSANFRR